MKRRVVQRHHISRFDKERGTPEVMAHVFRFEHELLTKMDRILRSKCSSTFFSEMWHKVLQLQVGYTEDDMREYWNENQRIRKEKRNEREGVTR